MQSIEVFLAEVENRAFKMARIATGCDHDALDIVQDAMLSLVKSYGDKDPDSWKPLFYRIMQNRITDYHRKKTLAGKLFSWIGVKPREEDEGGDLISNSLDPAALSPELLTQQDRFSDALVLALEKLPQRQQQCFLLRIWEGLSVSDTAVAMGCSEGSVKTHLSRAVQALRTHLEPHYFSGGNYE